MIRKQFSRLIRQKIIVQTLVWKEIHQRDTFSVRDDLIWCSKLKLIQLINEWLLLLIVSGSGETLALNFSLKELRKDRDRLIYGALKAFIQ